MCVCVYSSPAKKREADAAPAMDHKYDGFVAFLCPTTSEIGVMLM